MTDDEFLGAAAAATTKAALTAKAETGPISTGARYSPDTMVDLMVAHPYYTPKQFAEHFGREKSWFYSVIASEAFQLRLAERKSEIADPALTATLDERFRSLTMKSLDVLHSKLDSKEVGDMLVTKAAEIGVKALGMGQVTAPPPSAPAPATIDQLAERLTAALEKQRRNSNLHPANQVVQDVEAKPAKALPSPTPEVPRVSMPTVGVSLAELRGKAGIPK